MEYKTDAIVRMCGDEKVQYYQIMRIFIIDNIKLFELEELEAAFYRHLMAFKVTKTGRRLVCLCNSLARPGVLHPKLMNGKTYITEKDSADIDWCTI